MATIRQEITLQDRFSGPLLNIVSSTRSAVTASDRLRDSMSQDSLSDGVSEANKELETMYRMMDLSEAQTQDMINSMNGVEDAVSEVGNAIILAMSEMRNFSDETDRTNDNANSLADTIKSIGAAMGGVFAINKINDFISEATSAADTQIRMERQLATTFANMGGNEEGYNALLAKASEIQGRGQYGDEAMIGAAAEFATYMSDTSAIEMMMDTLTNYAAGMSGGGALDSTQLVDYATNLGKITTGAYDAMTKKGFEFTDAQKAVIDGTATQAQYLEVLGDNWQDLSEDMRSATVISDIINESWAGMYESLSNTPEAKLQSLKNTFGDIQELVGNKLNQSLSGLWDVLANNMGTIEAIMLGVAGALNVVIGIATGGMELIGSVAGLIVDNWSLIAPILGGVAAALMVLQMATMSQTIATLAQSAATAIATAQQWLFNTALYGCPVVWIALAVMALVAAVIAFSGSIAQATGVAQSGFGLIAGAVAVALAFIANLFLGFYNTLMTLVIGVINAFLNFAASLSIMFNDPIASIKAIFLSLFDFILSTMQSVAALLDAVFGSNLSDAVGGWRSGIQAEIDATIEGAGGTKAELLDVNDFTMDRIDYGEAFNAGAEWGDGIASTLGNSEWSSSWGNLSSGGLGGLDANGLSNAVGNGIDGSGTGSAVKSSLEATEEDLKYLRDIAEQEAINRFTTAEITINNTNNNSVGPGMDLDDMVDGMTTGLQEALVNLTEGIHA